VIWIINDVVKVTCPEQYRKMIEENQKELTTECRPVIYTAGGGASGGCGGGC
jgi:hypothetical protein